MPYQAKTYSHIQHIAFEAPTFEANTYGNASYTSKLKTNINLPYAQNLSTDVKNRILTVVHLVQTAQQALIKNGADAATCLKVFTIPEFFFRPAKAEASCLDRSYSENTKNAIVKNLRSMLGRPDYKDWLFVLGSIIWTVKLNKMEGLNPTLANVGDTDKGVRNTCIMMKGGSTDAPIQLFDKVHLSAINEISEAAWSGTHFNALQARPKISAFFESYNSRKNCLFKFDNLTICAEICLDHHHQLKVAQKTLVEMALLGQKEKAHIHFVIACGMPIEQESISCKQDGYLIRNDGHGGTKPFSQTVLVNFMKKDYCEDKNSLGQSLKRKDMANWIYPDSQNSINNKADRNHLTEGLTYFTPQSLPA